MSFVLVSPSTLSWSHVRAAAGRSSPWSVGRLDRRVGQDDREHRRHPGVDHPDALGDAGDPDAADREAVGIGQGDRHGRGLRPRVGRPEGLGGRGERVVGRREARRERVDAGGDLVERQPRADDAGREEERPLPGDPERAGEERRDLGLVGVAGGAGRGVGASRSSRRSPSPSPNAPLRPPDVCREVRLREPDGRGRERVRGEDRRRARRRPSPSARGGDDREVRPARRLDPGDGAAGPEALRDRGPPLDGGKRARQRGQALRPSVVAAGSDCPCPGSPSSSRRQRELLETGGLGQAVDEVERLDRLARGALDEVVEDADREDAAGPRVGRDVDPDVVAAE